jgi:TonB-linked SusC/RagA family outer membrane protein
MRKYIYLFLLSTLILLPVSVKAQIKAQTIISGRVYDAMGPIVSANVVEIDNNSRVQAQGITDANGNFSFKLRDPNDKIKVTYIGYNVVILPIDRTTFNIKMSDNTTLKDVVVKGTKMTSGFGMAIPEREVSGTTQTIGAEEFEGLPVTTIDEALQGRIAGLDIVMNSGDLGAGSSMRLRGVSTINANAEPLIVVDGNVFATDVSNFDFNTANDEKFAELLKVNPEDIASISVLKDASATAIWGSQGVNGVIEIKMKRGTRGKTRLTYSYRLSGTYQPNGMKMLNGDEYTMLLKEEYFNPTQSDQTANIRELNYDKTYSEYQMYKQNTDWVSAVRKMGVNQQHHISMNGGGEKANYRISAGYDNQTGTALAQTLNRFSTRVNLDYVVSDRIKVVSNFDMTYTDNRNCQGSLLSLAYQKMPNLSIYELDNTGKSTGQFYHMMPNVSQQLNDQVGIANPVALAALTSANSTNYSINPEFVMEYQLLGTQPGTTQLKYRGRVTFSISNSYSDNFYSADMVTKGWNDGSVNSASTGANKNMSITTTHELIFNPSFKNKDHSFMAMGRFQASSNRSNSQNTGSRGLPSGTITSPGAGGIITGFGTGVGQSKNLYMTFTAHYAYKGRYIADLTVRRDGTTKFSEAKRWGTFPSISTRWNISDEDFMKKISWLDMLALRGSVGFSGNGPGAEYLYFSRYANGAAYNERNSVYPSNIRLTNLRWEKRTGWNLGSDIGVLNGKFSGSLEGYYNKTTDLIMGTSIPTSSGYNSLSARNVGSLCNYGYELSLNGYRLVKVGRMGMDFNINFSNSRNELLTMDQTIMNNYNKEYDRKNGSYLSRVQLNMASGSIYGFRSKGVYQYSKYSDAEVVGVSGPNAPVVKNAKGEPILDEKGSTKPMYFCYGTTVATEFKGGDAKYEDINHDGNINELDIVYLGSTLPKIIGGFGFKLNYGRFQWNNQFVFRAGNKVVNQARMNAEKMYDNTNQSRAVNWRWRVEGDETSIPRALKSAGYNWLGSDRFVEDASYIRMNYTQVNYSVDPKLLKKYRLSQLSLYVSFNNPFVLTHYSGADPEVPTGGTGVAMDNSRTPRSKSFTGGVTIAF